ncbi:sulfite exporter TauE/SafE family protein [Cupriavidus sp. SZY C1]|uniref:sulfite exporter TauE/SafE family protein n=1 Tax=Cupriavidus sp. SZY C1 TaxID=3055037 RepID=UPI0028B983FC|nr:sulfite exporter TauE/SafE family protein [Cupriavidus sp. SZY C1]MDT6964130.1 sulfite exporter TauE/SafE family protein [Cupriavidus sp. SZY C1]
MDPILMVFGAGFVAGAMNALAGGGSFVSLPAMIAAGVPPVQANTSSTVALFPGGLASAWAYRDGLGPVGAVSLRALLVATLCGGLAGALLLLRTPSAAFTFVLPWLLLVACVALAFGRQLGEALRRRCHVHANAVLAVQFALGVYGGYFGGAVGIMMIAMWGLLDSRDIKRLNAPRTLMVSAANAVAVIAFIVAGAVRWPETLAMLIGAVLGGYGGALLGKLTPPRVVRAGTLLATSCITLAFFVKTYAPGMFR